jgi:hypothetical protein
MAVYLPPTTLQTDLIKSIKFIISSWENTNDLSSPTHFVDITEELNKFYYDGVDREFVDKLNDAADNILKLIRDADRHFDKTK